MKDLLNFMSKATEFRRTPKYDIFQNELFLISTSSTNLVLKVGQHLLRADVIEVVLVFLFLTFISHLLLVLLLLTLNK